jgi:hypothetical protein
MLLLHIVHVPLNKLKNTSIYLFIYFHFQNTVLNTPKSNATGRGNCFNAVIAEL